MSGHDIVVIGASAGGIEAIREVVSRFPGDLAAAVFVVLHLPQGSRSTLPEIISRSGPLPAVHPKDGERIGQGRIYVAPPDHHLLLDDGHVVLSRGPHHNRHRPAVDPLFGSAALNYGGRVVGVVLSGTLDDGTAGLARIKRRGGVALVQDPRSAEFAGMPESAIAHVAVDRVVSVDRLAEVIGEYVCRPAPDTAPPPDARLALDFERDLGMHTDVKRIGKPSVYACPECHGTLWELDEDGVLQFCCRVGHSFSTEGLQAEHDDSLEATLWSALRAMEENISLRRRLAERSRARQPRVSEQYENRARMMEDQAKHLRQLLTSEESPTSERATTRRRGESR